MGRPTHLPCPQDTAVLDSTREPQDPYMTFRTHSSECSSNLDQIAYPCHPHGSEMRNFMVRHPDQRYAQHQRVHRQQQQPQQPNQQQLGYPHYPPAQTQHCGFWSEPSPPSLSTEIPPPGYNESLHQNICMSPLSCGHSAGHEYPSRLPDHPSARSKSPPFMGKLNKPVAIPAAQATLGSPFLRAYPPVLLHFGISRDKFLQFLDGLNRAAVIQALGLAGNIVSLVPLATTQIVGNSLDLPSGIGTAAVSKSRVELHLRAANREIFGPKGLKAEIAKLSALAVMANMPILGPDGKVDKNTSILGGPDHDDEDTLALPAQHRRIRALERWVERLEIEGLPAVAQSSNPISNMHASASEHQRRKEEQKLGKARVKAQREWQKESQKLEREYHRKMRQLERDEKRARRNGEERKLDGIAYKRDKVQGKFGTKMDKGAQRGNRPEEKLLRKICFLTITNADGPSHVSLYG